MTSSAIISTSSSSQTSRTRSSQPSGGMMQPPALRHGSRMTAGAGFRSSPRYPPPTPAGTAPDQVLVGPRASIPHRVRRRHLAEALPSKRLVRAHHVGLAADGERRKRCAVIAVGERYHFVLARAPDLQPVHARDLHGTLI